MHVAEYKQLFLREAHAKLREFEGRLEELEQSSRKRDVAAKILIINHKLKSNAATMSYNVMANALHQTEDFFTAVRDGAIRISAQDIDNLYLLLDAFRTNLQHIKTTNTEIDLAPAIAFIIRKTLKGFDGKKSKRIRLSRVRSETLPTPATRYEPLGTYVDVSSSDLDTTLDKVNDLISYNQQLQRMLQKGDTGGVVIGLHSLASKLSDLRHGIVRIKMMPVRQYFAFITRLVRDLSRQGRKFITLTFEDNNLRFERRVLDSLRDIGTQLVKNAVDHGFREGEQGKVTLRFELKSNTIYVTVQDNGHGIDWKALGEQAIRQRKISARALHRLSPLKQKELLFHLGVSSRREASITSGRGIGWPTIRAIVDQLHGTMSVTSERSGKNHGATFSITIPITPTMFRALTWQWGSYYVALPLYTIQKVIQLPTQGSVKIGKWYIYNKKRVPVADWLKLSGCSRALRNSLIPDAIAILSWNEQSIALVLPAGTSEQEIIVESLHCIAGNHLVAGAAVSTTGIPMAVLNHQMLLEQVYGKG